MMATNAKLSRVEFIDIKITFSDRLNLFAKL